MLTYRGNRVDTGAETTFLDLAERYGGDYDSRIMLAKVDQKIIELCKPVGQELSGELTFITAADPDGHRTYERGATMMLLRAMTHVFGRRIKKLKLEYAVGDSLYFSVELKDGELTGDGISDVKRTMERYARDDERFVKDKMQTDELVSVFRRHGMTDKVRLFHYRRASTTNVYRFGNYIDYYYGYMPPSAGYVSVFDIEKADGGLFLVLPNRSAPDSPGSPYVPKKLFGTMRQSDAWGENIGITTVGDLNDAISRGEGADMILASEAYQEHRIGEIAARIKDEGRRIIMVAGPSSSGKTSFSHRLSIQLSNVGLKAHPIACDNYYVERTKTPRDESGDYDFECLEALNVELFNEQMKTLLSGGSTVIPTFNFRKGVPEFDSAPLSMGKDEVLVIEGIHGLNEKLSYAIDPGDKFKIYISAVTALNLDEHNRIPTTDNREIRRMVRDARTRGFSASDTISRWPSVRRGEERHIFPFQEDADVMFNSASLYELAVLKTFAEPLLFSIPKDAPEYPEAKRLLKFLEYFLGLSCEDVPRNSLVREFIGGSIFPVG